MREVVEHLSRSLADRGHEVRVFGLENSDWRNGDCDRWSGAQAVVAPVHGPRVLGFAPGWRHKLRAFSADVLHLHGLWMASASVAAGWAKCTPSGVLTVSPHGMLSQVALGYSPGRKRLARMLYQDRCFAATDLFHATSDVEAAEIRAYGLSAPVSIVPNGLNDMPDHLPGSAPSRDRIVITLGRLHKVKGLDRLLRVWARLQVEFPAWQLQIVGPDARDGYGARLSALAAELGLQRVAFPGAAFGDDKWRALQRAELFVLPTESENFALTVPEALLAGLPVISTDGAPWAALMDKGCGWYVPRSDDALAGALSEAMHLPEERRRAMGQAGRDWVLRDFRWPIIAERFERSYAAALAEKRVTA